MSRKPKVEALPAPDDRELFFHRVSLEEAASEKQFLFTVADSPEAWVAYLAGEAGDSVDPRVGPERFRVGMVRVAALALAAYEWSLNREKQS